jgi:hypothetical protein
MGGSPAGGLVLDAAGNIYGTTEYGGPNGYFAGVAFMITPQPEPLRREYGENKN